MSTPILDRTFLCGFRFPEVEAIAGNPFVELNAIEQAECFGHACENCGVFFTRDSKSHFAAMGVSASYIAAATESRDQIDWNPEWSRRGRGIAIYAALRELGRNGVEQPILRAQHSSAVPHGAEGEQ